MLAASNEKKEGGKSENKEKKLLILIKIFYQKVATIIICGLKFFEILIGKIS